MTHRIHTEIAAKSEVTCWAFVAFGPDGCAVYGGSGVAESGECAEAELETFIHAVSWAVRTGTSAAVYTSYFPFTVATPEPLHSLLKSVKQDRNVSISLLSSKGRRDVIGASAAHHAAKSALDRFLRTRDVGKALWDYPLNKVRLIPTP